MPHNVTFETLRPSERLPVLFLGHGSPMNVIEDSPFRRGWQALGAEFGVKYPRPSLILCISAHWLTSGWRLTAMPKPRTIHDFGGFPQELFAQQYPAPGWPAAAREIGAAIGTPSVAMDESEWGFDHGSWGVLKPMFPTADIPVLQLSMDYDRPPAEHFALGRRLAPLRERGVLIVGSGNIVHNLRAARWGEGDGQTYDWSARFDQTIAGQIERGELAALADFQRLGDMAQLAQPTHEHFLPLLYAAGAANPGRDQPGFFNDSYQLAAISMRSVVWY